MRQPYLPFLYLTLKSSRDDFNVLDNFNVSSIKTANVHGKCFSLKARILKFSKLIEISCLQVIKSKLTIIP